MGYSPRGRKQLDMTGRLSIDKIKYIINIDFIFKNLMRLLEKNFLKYLFIWLHQV